MIHVHDMRDLVRRLHPGTDRAEVWLKVHGANLHRYGATWE
jgi:predicted metal-dependent hydrolase